MQPLARRANLHDEGREKLKSKAQREFFLDYFSRSNTDGTTSLK